MKFYHLLFILLMSFASCSKPVVTETGVSSALAAERKILINKLQYQLHFNIPESKQEPVKGKEKISFILTKRPEKLILDFKENPDHILSVTVEEKPVNYLFQNEHIIIPGKHLKKGENDIDITFIAGDLSLNRQEEFLYTLFVPDRARTAFPCFDQPDLKALFTLSLEIPAHWEAVANGKEIKNIPEGDRKKVYFSETKKLPTYLFAFTAGEFMKETRKKGSFMVNLFHREADSILLENNVDEIFRQVFTSIDWLEEYTNIAYPFAKYDLIAIPSFQYGGMEHTGATLYRAGRIILPPSPTQEQLLARANLIAHETSHMWFGDLVTMKWFNEVWLKEVFANFIAEKITNPWFPEMNHELKFLQAHYPPAYEIDRSPGANPIQQNLDNMQDAGTVYGSIIYHKAPLVMKKLEEITGEEEMKKGLQEYLKNYSYDNATWNNLITILDSKTEEDLRPWSKVWVEEPGMPVYTCTFNNDSLFISQSDPANQNRIWSDNIEISIPSNIQNLNFGTTKTEYKLPVAEEAFLNSSGMGYGYFSLSEASHYFDRFIAHYKKILPLSRSAQWKIIYENLLHGKIEPGQFLLQVNHVLPVETNPQIIEEMLTMQKSVFWHFLTREGQMEIENSIIDNLWKVYRDTDNKNRKMLFNQIVSLSLSKDHLIPIKKILLEKKYASLSFSETELINISYQLLLKMPEEYDKLSMLQESRIENKDRLEAYHFIIKAIHPNKEIRQDFFTGLKEAKNRERESWVVTALSYLNHPLRQKDEIDNLYEYLELLPEIKETGDIFFPKRWLDAVLSGHNSEEARAIVSAFITDHPELSESLLLKVEQSADYLYRSEKIMNNTVRKGS